MLAQERVANGMEGVHLSSMEDRPPPESSVHGVVPNPQPQSTGPEQKEDAEAQRHPGAAEYGLKGPIGKEQPASNQAIRARSPPPRSFAGGYANGASTFGSFPQVVVSRKSLFEAGYLLHGTGKPPNECTVRVAVNLDPWGSVLPYVNGVCNPEHLQTAAELETKFAKDTSENRQSGEKTSYCISYGALLKEAQSKCSVAWDSPLGVALACAVEHELSWVDRLCQVTLTKVDMGRWRPGAQAPGSMSTPHAANPSQPPQTFSQHHAAQDHAQDDIHAAHGLLMFMATGRKQEAQGEELDTGGFSTRTRGGSRSNERGPGAASDSRQLDAQGQSFVVEGDDTQAAGDYWLQWAGDLDPNDGHQIKITKDVLRIAGFAEPYGEEISVPMQVFVCGRPRCLWDDAKEFKQITVKLAKKGATNYFSIKMGQLVKSYLAEEWDALMSQYMNGSSNIASLMKAMVTWKVEAVPDLPTGGVAWDPELRIFPVRLRPQANSQSQQRKQGVVLGSEKKKPGRKKRSRSFNTDDEQEPKKSKYDAQRRASAPGGFDNGSLKVKVKNKGGRPRKVAPAAAAAAGGEAGASVAARGAAAGTAGASTRGRPRKSTVKIHEQVREDNDGNSDSSSSSQDDEGVQGATAAGALAPRGGAGMAQASVLPRSTAGTSSGAADIGGGMQEQRQQQQQQLERLRASRNIGLKCGPGQPPLGFAGAAAADAGLPAIRKVGLKSGPGQSPSGFAGAAVADAGLPAIGNIGLKSGPGQSPSGFAGAAVADAALPAIRNIGLKCGPGQSPSGFAGAAVADAGLNATSAFTSMPVPGIKAAESAAAAAVAASNAVGKGRTSGLGLLNRNSAFKGPTVQPAQASGSGGGGNGGLQLLHHARAGSPSQAPSNHQGNAALAKIKLDIHEYEQRFECALVIQKERHAQMKEAADKVQQLAVDLSKLEEALGRFEKCGLSKEDRDLLCSHLILPGMAKVQEDLEARHQEATAARGLWESAKKAEKQAYEEYDNMQARIDS